MKNNYPSRPIREALAEKYGTQAFGSLLEPHESDVLHAENEDHAMCDFVDWIDELLMSRQINRLKDRAAKWYYNHKPEAAVGKQEWNAYTTIQLLEIYKQTLR